MTETSSKYNNSKKILWIKFIAHLIVLLMIFIGPELIFSIGRNVHNLMLLTPLCYIILFYLNYYFLTDKLMFSKKTFWLYILINIILTVVITYIFYHVETSLRPTIPLTPPTFKPDGILPPPLMPSGNIGTTESHIFRALTMIPRIGTMALLSISLSILIKLSEKWNRWENQKQKLKTELQEIELKNLKSQLNPHFLFNTLNNIYALIPICQEKAQKTVHELSQLLRYTLYNNENKEVPLEKEFYFIKNYISLMSLRLNSNVKLSVNINDTDCAGKKIAPLLFISLIENAFKHGISSDKTSFINIDIRIFDNTVNCHVENSLFPKKDNDKSGSGIGITNLKRQLEILYDGRYTLNIKKDDERYTADLSIILTSPKQPMI